jgi:hypothetical protein
MKKCAKCKINKPIIEFYKNKSHKDGLKSECKDCTKAWRMTNKERLNNYQKKYYQLEKEGLKRSRQKFYLDHKEEILNYSKQYQLQHKEDIARRNKERYLEEKRKKIVTIKVNGLGEKLYICAKCKEDKTKDGFSPNKKKTSGFCSYCKVCKLQYYYNNRERLLVCGKQWAKENKEKVAKYQRKYYLKKMGKI